jgi:hypothetical protein
MTLGISHAEREGERTVAVLDHVSERRPPFSPEAIVREFATTLRAYRIDAVTGDRYGGQWVSEAFSRAGIGYMPSERNKSELYLETLPLLNSGRVQLLDHPRLMQQFLGLERRTSRVGKDSVDHAPGGHDDLANSVAGACVLAATQSWVADGEPFAVNVATERRSRLIDVREWAVGHRTGW